MEEAAKSKSRITRRKGACENCRSRKLRCDGTRPCGQCTKSKTKCSYQSPISLSSSSSFSVTQNRRLDKTRLYGWNSKVSNGQYFGNESDSRASVLSSFGIPNDNRADRIRIHTEKDCNDKPQSKTRAAKHIGADTNATAEERSGSSTVELITLPYILVDYCIFNSNISEKHIEIWQHLIQKLVALSHQNDKSNEDAPHTTSKLANNIQANHKRESTSPRSDTPSRIGSFSPLSCPDCSPQDPSLIESQWARFQNRQSSLASRMRLLSLTTSMTAAQETNQEIVNLVLEACMSTARETLEDLGVLQNWPSERLLFAIQLSSCAWAVLLAGIFCGYGNTGDTRLLGVVTGLFARLSFVMNVNAGLDEVIELSAEGQKVINQRMSDQLSSRTQHDGVRSNISALNTWNEERSEDYRSFAPDTFPNRHDNGAYAENLMDFSAPLDWHFDLSLP